MDEVASGAQTVSAESYRKVLSHFPTGVVIVTACAADGPAGLTLQSFMALSLSPPLILLSVDRNSQSWPKIVKQSKLAVNLLASDQHDLALTFARSGGLKFDGVAWSPGKHSGAPLFPGAQAWIECEINQIYDGGDHEIITATVLHLEASPNLATHPLIFARSRFSRIDPAEWNP